MPQNVVPVVNPEGANNTKSLGAWLDELCQASGMSRNGLAAAVETDRKNIDRWLTGRNEPSGIQLLRTLRALGVVIAPAPPDEIAAPLNVQLDEIATKIDEIAALLRQRRLEGLEAAVGAVSESQTRALEAIVEIQERIEQLEKAQPARSTKKAGR